MNVTEKFCILVSVIFTIYSFILARVLTFICLQIHPSSCSHHSSTFLYLPILCSRPVSLQPYLLPQEEHSGHPVPGKTIANLFFCNACVCSSQQIGQLHTDFLHCYLFVIYGAAGQAACQTELKPFQNVFLERAHKLTQAHIAITVGQCSTGLIVDHMRSSLFVSAHPLPPQALSTVYF